MRFGGALFGHEKAHKICVHCCSPGWTPNLTIPHALILLSPLNSNLLRLAPRLSKCLPMFGRAAECLRKEATEVFLDLLKFCRVATGNNSFLERSASD